MAELYGLVGEKLSHSFSPEIHQTIFEELCVEGDYKLFEYGKSDSDRIIEDLHRNEVHGANITIPYKETVIQQLDQISKEAKKIGSVNTVYLKNGNAMGHNTDYYGILKTFEILNFDAKNSKAVILGTGGASKAVKAVLRYSGASEVISVSRKGRPAITYDDLYKMEDKDIIINATPVGMYPNIDKSPVKKEVFKRFKYAFDLTYNPSETVFLKDAKESGCITIGGISMLIYQAIRSQEIWQCTNIGKEKEKQIYDKVLSKLNLNIK